MGKIQTFGDRLAKFQSQSGMQTSKIAEMFSIDPNFVRLMIRGLRYPGKPLLSNFCESFNEPLEKWLNIIRWEREENLEIKALLASKLYHDWSFEGTPAELNKQDCLYDPASGLPLPVFNIPGLQLQWKEVIEKINKEADRQLAHTGLPAAFWLKLDSEQKIVSRISEGDHLLMKKMQPSDQEDVFKKRLVVACSAEGAVIFGKIMEYNNQSVVINSTTTPEHISFETADSSLQLFFSGGFLNKSTPIQ